MPAFLHALNTAVPPFALSQIRIRDEMLARLPPSRMAQRLTRRVYDQSTIETRHTVLPDLETDDEKGFLFADGQMNTPGSAARNQRYADAACTLATQAVRGLFDTQPPAGFRPDDITHLVTVSCTGFIAPGIDCHLIETLGLRPDAPRFHLGFMGCCAAFPALRLAHSLCLADPRANVLVVCVECCTLHLKRRTDPDSIISGAVFADGAAAALVSAREPTHSAWKIERLGTLLLPDSAKDMAWSVGDEGFEMVLSTYVPRVLGSEIQTALETLHGADCVDTMSHWAIHPGGRAILDHIQTSLALTPDDLAPSRDVLRCFGNMSSPTILFVIDAIANASPGESLCAMAFGPGLTLETGILTRT